MCSVKKKIFSHFSSIIKVNFVAMYDFPYWNLVLQIPYNMKISATTLLY